MFIKRKVSTIIEVEKGIQCDKCKKIYYYEGDGFEPYEFVSMAGCGGFGSKTVGDMTEWTLDLCQYCFDELCGEYLQIEKE